MLLLNARLQCKNNRRGSRRKGGVPTPLDIIGLRGAGESGGGKDGGIYKILSWMDVGPLGGHCTCAGTGCTCPAISQQETPAISHRLPIGTPLDPAHPPSLSLARESL